jgi:ATP-binding cassette subfamily B protein
MSADKVPTTTDTSLYRRVLRQVRPWWRHIGGIFVLSLLSTPLALLAPVPLKIAVDSVVGSKPLPGFLEAVWPSGVATSDRAMLIFAAGLLVLVVLLTQLQSLGSTLLRTYTGERMVLDFRRKLFRRVQRLSLSYHDMCGSSDSAYRIQNDAQAIQYIAIDGVIPFVTAAVTLVSMVYIIVRLDWQLAVIALAISPVLFAATRFNRRRLRKQSRDVKKLESSALGIIQEVLSAVRVVKAFVREDQEEDRFVTRSTEGMRARLRLAVLEGGLGLIVGLTTAFGTAAVLYIGVRHVQTNQLTLGELLLVMGYLSQLYEPLKTISRKTASLQAHLASAERAFALLDEEPDVIERPDAKPIVRADGAVTFRNVSFAYRNNEPVLHYVTLDVPSGTRLGIAGTTGAGKTTLVSLLCRFYDPTDGAVLLDGVDLRDYKVADLRNQFAIVLQEPVLFATTIAENIAYARKGASMAAIIEAAKAANAHDFILALPHGYDTLVGDRGMRLSGGERQRISLARAFLKDAPILVLDEPTSSVDIQTETLIMEAMDRLMEGRTTFMIAHRLSTLEHCDARARIENGHLVSAMTLGDWTPSGAVECDPPLRGVSRA